MTTEVAMPKLGLLMTEGEVVRWLAGDGQPIEQGKPIVNIMTKKINYQVGRADQRNSLSRRAG